MDEPALLPEEGPKNNALPNFEYLYERHPSRDTQGLKCRHAEYAQACERVGAVPYTLTYFQTLELRWRKARAQERYQWNPGEFLYCEIKHLPRQHARDESGALRGLCVAVAPYSEYSFACIYEGSLKWHSGVPWMRCLIKVYRHYGGAHHVTFCPCVDKKATNHKVNGMYYTLHAFAAHYGTVLLHPPESEVDEQATQQEILPGEYKGELGKYIYLRLKKLPRMSTEELSEKIAELLEEFNEGANSQGRARREHFECDEAHKLTSLPNRDYDMSIWNERVVKTDYHFDHGTIRYSVPFQYANKTVLVRSLEDTIEVYSGGEIIAVHQLHDGSDGRKVITDPSHRPDSHRAIANRLGKYFMQSARKIGPGTTAVMKELLDNCGANNGSHRACKDLLDLRNTPSELTLEEACLTVVREGMAKTVPVVSCVMGQKGR